MGAAAMEFDEEYTRYQVSRSRFRKLVRKLYLRRAASQLVGRTLDFGCGVGELLAILPDGSRGLEYNEATVAYCRSIGLPVSHYDGFADGWSLSTLSRAHGLQSMVISHVLEHLDDPAEVFRRLLTAAEVLGVHRVLVIVPGRAGFRIDPTHRTFVDETLLREALLPGWVSEKSFHFPFSAAWVGDYFAYNELHFRATRAESTDSAGSPGPSVGTHR
jgi:SAM-dependent methyltransferase